MAVANRERIGCVFPAPAGMNRARAVLEALLVSVPRARGDEP